MNDHIFEVSLPENKSDVDRRGMRKFFSRAGAVFLLLMVGFLLLMVGQHSDVLLHVGFAIMCSAILLGLAFMYESLERDERSLMRLGMYTAVGFFALLLVPLMLNVNLSQFTLLMISAAPLVILGPIDLLCCYFAQRTAAGLSQGVNLSQGLLAEPLLAPAATDLAAPVSAPVPVPVSVSVSAPAPGAVPVSVPVPVPVPANQAGATSNLFGQPADQNGKPDSTIELTTTTAPAAAAAAAAALGV